MDDYARAGIREYWLVDARGASPRFDILRLGREGYRTARKQLANGADFIKLLATGAITSTKYEKAEAIQYRREEIEAAVGIATDNLTYVAAHCHALDGIRNAVEAGCRSIEHGSFGDEAAYRLMVKTYHPDKADPFMRSYCEEMLKIVNRAMARIESEYRDGAPAAFSSKMRPT